MLFRLFAVNSYFVDINGVLVTLGLPSLTLSVPSVSPVLNSEGGVKVKCPCTALLSPEEVQAAPGAAHSRQIRSPQPHHHGLWPSIVIAAQKRPLMLNSRTSAREKEAEH